MKKYLLLLTAILVCSFSEQTSAMVAPPQWEKVATQKNLALTFLRNMPDETEAARFVQFVVDKRRAWQNTLIEAYRSKFNKSYLEVLKGETPPAPLRPEEKKKAAEEKKAAAVNFQEVKRQAQAVKTQGQMVVQQAQTTRLSPDEKDELANAIGFPNFATMQNAWPSL